MPPLRILVPIKRVIDYAVKPRVSKTATSIETSGVKHSMNPFDELAIEEAVRLRERKIPSHSVETIIAVSAGPAKAADVLRTALAVGADSAIHVMVDPAAVSTGAAGEGERGSEAISEGALEPLAVAKVLKRIVEEEKINLVLMGKQAIDDDAGQTGPMLAGLLGWSQATQAAKLLLPGEVDPSSSSAALPYASEGGKEANDAEGTVRVVKEVDGGVETVRARLPMVVTTDLRLNEPRYASLPNIMKAKKKPMVKRALDEMGVDVRARLRTVKVEEPPARKGGVKVEDVDGFVGKLKELGAI